ncbi:MAG: tetratricopeptide repeat protein [Novosphingobium sp.]
MRKFQTLAGSAILALFSTAQPLLAQADPAPLSSAIKLEAGRPHADELDQAVNLLLAGKPKEAEAIFSAIIADFEKTHDPALPYRCAYSDTAKATIAYTLEDLKGKPFTLGGDVWCVALWGKGFALIDLNRSDEAGTFLARSVEMAPVNAHYINEYAEWYKPRRDWKTSYALFERAWRTVDHDSKGPNRTVAARALRGMAYNQIELGDLDRAEQLYKQSLEYEPEAAGKVNAELQFIAQQRAKR